MIWTLASLSGNPVADAFYATLEREPAADEDVLVLSCDGKGIVMRPGSLRPATEKAAASATTKLEAACERALAVRALGYRSAESILRAGLPAPAARAPHSAPSRPTTTSAAPIHPESNRRRS